MFVAIFPKLPSASLEDFTVRTAAAWRIGRKGLDDGVILFAFVEERQLRIEVGYGLEDRIPDAIAKRILEEHITPYLREGQADAGFAAGVEAILAAAEGQPLPATAATPAAAPVPVPATGLPEGLPELGPFGEVMQAILRIAHYQLGGLPVGLAFLVVAFPTLTSPILRFLPIRRRVKRGEPLPKAWLVESGILLWLILSNIRTSRGGGSSYGGSSSSGGGGRFGGGGASGSW